MMNLLRNFWNEEDGMGTVEIVLIVVVLISLAVMFRKSIVTMVKGILDDTETQMNAFDAAGTP